MTHFFNNRCPVCGTVMVHIQRRGSSVGIWMCPVCTTTRHPGALRAEEPPYKNPDPRQTRLGSAA